MNKVYAVNISEGIDSYAFNYMLSEVSPDKQNKIVKYCNFKDSVRSLIGDILIRYIIIKKLKIRNEDISFSLNKYGKPYLNIQQCFEFNISHSGDWVVCSISDDLTGVDVEEIKPIDISIAKRFFCNDEAKNIYESDENSLLDTFYSYWTLKESFIKAIGRGMSIPLDSFKVVFEEDEILSKYNDNDEIFFFKEYCLGESYKLSVCSKENIFASEVIFIGMQELYREMVEYECKKY